MNNFKYNTIMFYLLFPNVFFLFSSFFISPNEKITQPYHQVHYMGFSKLETTSDYLNLKDTFNKVDSSLVKKFYDIQTQFGRPLKVIWGYRDQKTNRKIGGARNSAHLYGKALDIVLDSASKEDIKRLIKISSSLGILGIGVYRDSKTIHIDIDEKKGRRAWGSDYSSSSIPKWATVEIKEHLSKCDSLSKPEHIVEVKSDSVRSHKSECSTKKTDIEMVQKKEPKIKDKLVVYYIIKKGDTIYSLAKNNNTTVNDICELNKIYDTTKIKIGQKIRIK